MQNHSTNLTVLMPARNASATLELAIRSTAFALRPGDELIVICEESDKLGRAIVGEVKRSTQVWSLIVPDGTSFSEKLNTGAARARHDYLARMDADDICLPWRFSLQMNSVAAQDLDLCCTTSVIFGRDLRPAPVLPQIPIGLNDFEIKDQLSFGNPIMHPTVVVRRDSLLAIGGYEPRHGEDLHLWLKGACAGWKMKRLATPCLLYRYSRRSMSRQNQTKMAVLADPEISRMRQELAETIRPTVKQVAEGEVLLVPRSKKLSFRNLKRWLSRLNFNLNN